MSKVKITFFKKKKNNGVKWSFVLPSPLLGWVVLLCLLLGSAAFLLPLAGWCCLLLLLLLLWGGAVVLRLFFLLKSHGVSGRQPATLRRPVTCDTVFEEGMFHASTDATAFVKTAVRRNTVEASY